MVVEAKVAGSPVTSRHIRDILQAGPFDCKQSAANHDIASDPCQCVISLAAPVPSALLRVADSSLPIANSPWLGSTVGLW